MMSWLRKDRGARVNPDALINKAEQSITKTVNQEPHVNFINGWLDRRYQQNGLGDDFEWTLKAKGE